MSDREIPLCPHCCEPYAPGQDLCSRCHEPVGDHAVLYYDAQAGLARPRRWARRVLVGIFILYVVAMALFFLIWNRQ